MEPGARTLSFAVTLALAAGGCSAGPPNAADRLPRGADGEGAEGGAQPTRPGAARSPAGPSASEAEGEPEGSSASQAEAPHGDAVAAERPESAPSAPAEATFVRFAPGAAARDLAVRTGDDGHTQIAVVGTFVGETGATADRVASGGDGHAALYAASFDGAGAVLAERPFFGSEGFADAHVALSSAGDVWLAGAFEGALRMGDALSSEQPPDIFVAKLRRGTLAPILARRVGGRGEQYVAGVAPSSDGGVFVVGGFDGELDVGRGPLDARSTDEPDAFLLAVSSDGTVSDPVSIGGASFDSATAVATGGGRVAVTGVVAGEAAVGDRPLPPPSAAEVDAFVATFTAEGAVRTLYRSRGEPASVIHPERVAFVSDDRVVVGGVYTGAVDLGGGTLEEPAPGAYRIFVAWLDAGALVGAVTFADGSMGAVRGLAASATGEVYLATEHVSPREDRSPEDADRPSTSDMPPSFATSTRAVLLRRLAAGGRVASTRRFANARARGLSCVGAAFAPVLAATVDGPTDFGAGPLTGPGLVVARLAP
jgi:hypothetical protein